MVNSSKIKELTHNPYRILPYLASKGLLKWVPDKLYLKLLFRARMGRKLNIKEPRTYNEKLQWLKLYDRNPLYEKLVDKYEVREYIASKIGEKYLIPLLGQYDNFEEIDFDKLPDQFVMKCTHDSGGLVICKDKSKLDIEAAREKINKSLKRNYYYHSREWPYKNVKPKIIIEKYMVDESGFELKDYKFFCFNGDPKSLFIATDRGIDTRFDFFDMKFNHFPFWQHYKNSNKKINRPAGFEEMVKLSEILSEGIPHVRVDFYDINGEIYFGELTFYHFSGMERFYPNKYDEIFGDWLDIPSK
ncbi:MULTISPECIES: ATP-grasp fold amidoligase family protein [Bacillus]|uniref:ATP-grasp fold amidoligase family protein n=1 Tax=Bacillus TaxID=1386 RepID=UPI00122EE7E6|nr:ATP-grasp fold amidoligase family protein [Bacillus cereus]KAA2398114.1 glycosyl transferase [Bacillus cereus]MDH8002807.1 ATP-grasp fold amidoligase family protein [Bacillus cereus]NKW86038.1 glycosyl transferase [Bacillus cereus]